MNIMKSQEADRLFSSLVYVFDQLERADLGRPPDVQPSEPIKRPYHPPKPVIPDTACGCGSTMIFRASRLDGVSRVVVPGLLGEPEVSQKNKTRRRKERQRAAMEELRRRSPERATIVDPVHGPVRLTVGMLSQQSKQRLVEGFKKIR